MSKVYSFRLDENNPREFQAREVIDTWISKGYSLRYLLTESLLSFTSKATNHSDLQCLTEQLEKLVGRLEDNPTTETLRKKDVDLPASFIESVTQSAKVGVKTS